MKKIAMSVAAATMLLGGLAGCGTDNQATDMGANNYQTGARAQDMRDGGATTGRYQGEGPLTDMMTRDDRTTTGLGTDRSGQRGIGQGRTGQTGLDAGQGRAGGFFGLERDGTRTHLNNYQTRGNRDGVHYSNTGRDTVGTNQGLFGTQGAQGIYGRQGTDAGTDRAGLTGGNRPGMVDEDGILRGRARGGTGALGTTQGHRRQGQGAMNLEGRRGLMNQGTEQGTTDQGNRTGVHQGQGRQAQDTVNYHKDYDGQTAQRMVERIEKVEGVEEARVIVHEDDVVIGITANEDINNVKKEVEKTAKGLAKDKEVRVTTDNDVVGRIRTMDDQLRTGTAFDEIGATFTSMLNDLGRAVQRPFERSR
ncbi:YhcN/YlaJ family sporulation lipoprotein [Alkalihalobacillus deserti]|uniref:YhcN/YlaJ family sporulation lipoprotein n=1 Tax=Alkalihalobacillus deserti TaxID=2879466 RepID=UPI001D13355E|nr:YhcN/YlaJ family sporulation lipoprotein [Alkalihalobacillus deserti]